jgi:hypothetical protein
LASHNRSKNSYYEDRYPQLPCSRKLSWCILIVKYIY